MVLEHGSSGVAVALQPACCAPDIISHVSNRAVSVIEPFDIKLVMILLLSVGHDACSVIPLFGLPAVCGDNCGATVVDPQTELLVCAVSGRCFDRIIDEREDKGDEVGSWRMDWQCPWL